MVEQAWKNITKHKQLVNKLRLTFHDQADKIFDTNIVTSQNSLVYGNNLFLILGLSC